MLIIPIGDLTPFHLTFLARTPELISSPCSAFTMFSAVFGRVSPQVAGDSPSFFLRYICLCRWSGVVSLWALPSVLFRGPLQSVYILPFRGSQIGVVFVIMYPPHQHRAHMSPQQADEHLLSVVVEIKVCFLT